MNIDIKDRITLDGQNEYLVVSKINYEDKIFYLLLNVTNYKDIKICFENKEKFNTLVESEDSTLNKMLMPSFMKEAINSITKEEIETIKKINKNML